MSELEQQVIDYLRTAIASFDTNDHLVRAYYYYAHDLFGDHINEWSEEFCRLYQELLGIWRMRTPAQPPIPTSGELVERFDARLSSCGRSGGMCVGDEED